MEDANDTKTAYQQKMETQLTEWSAQIAALRAQADQATAQGKIDLNKKIEGLQQLESDAKAKLEKLAAAPADDNVWHQLKKGLDDTWDSLGRALTH